MLVYDTHRTKHIGNLLFFMKVYLIFDIYLLPHDYISKLSVERQFKS